MARICSAHQPSYLPWAPLFYKMALADVWIHADDVAYQKFGIQNRHLLKGPQGAFWVTVPVNVSLGETIREVHIAQERFRPHKHWRSIEVNYGKAPFFRLYRDRFYQIYQQDWLSLCNLNLALVDLFCDILEINCTMMKSSDFGFTSTSSQRILDLCKAVNANVFLSGSGGVRYMDMSLFEEAGIEVLFQRPQTPEYPQRYPKAGFIPRLSVLDVVMNLGPNAADYVRMCGRVVDEVAMRAEVDLDPTIMENDDILQ